MVQTNKLYLKLGIGVDRRGTLKYSTAFVYRFNTAINDKGA